MQLRRTKSVPVLGTPCIGLRVSPGQDFYVTIDT